MAVEHEMHYVAEVTIKKVERVFRQDHASNERVVGDVARVVVRGDDLDNLKTRLAKHIDLMEDEN